MNEYPAVLGIFSLRREEGMGFGSTKATHEQVTFWYARQLSADSVEAQPLSTSHVPSGIKQLQPLGDFLRTYTPEPFYYVLNPVAALNSLKDKIEQGPERFSRETLDEAERSFIKALMIDDIVVEGHHDLGKVHPEEKEFARLRQVVSTLVGLGTDFSVVQKARLSSFGVNLRKTGNYDESVTFFLKALEISGRDENLHFNLARTQYDQGDLQACLETLRKAVDLNPEFDEALKFIGYCMKQLAAARQHATQER